ncbi:uncharacterized protein BYT42DRAFT_101548 [Radiomyces spectabilis]|uniref:uncharacterized protein n=1 Tax=Radiomyces spectabilis TaxID=64574 RepID=UPI00221F52BB|nr:uncharacterized protein BYT42DRAFT_101548 [Radiomyces spectabilis]KAI8369238.1 hypothetical protein BYT42DRAFT_101548 [Radiomyces spectabilis]
MRELDGYAQGTAKFQQASMSAFRFFNKHNLNLCTELMESVAKEAIKLIDDVLEMDPNDRIDRLQNLGGLLEETLKRGEEKVALAKSTFDAVDRHCNRLDADLVKLEEEQTIGDYRITAQPGLEPSARSLREGADMRDRNNKRLERERKDAKIEKRVKKRKALKDGGSPPPSALRAQAFKNERMKHHMEKEKSKNAITSGKNGTNKSKTVIPMDANADPNEPLYCYCQQISYGEMVACDNADCEIEWFHLACVDLNKVPKGKWYCNNCLAKMKGKQRK